MNSHTLLRTTNKRTFKTRFYLDGRSTTQETWRHTYYKALRHGHVECLVTRETKWQVQHFTTVRIGE